MENNNNKFDEQIKSSLSNYEAAETGNWGRMERMLNTSAKAKKPVGLSVIIGVLAVVGVYFMYETFSSSDKPEAKELNKQENKVEIPSVTKTEITKPAEVKPMAVPAVRCTRV